VINSWISLDGFLVKDLVLQLLIVTVEIVLCKLSIVLYIDGFIDLVFGANEGGMVQRLERLI